MEVFVQKRIFIICPVRNVDAATNEKIRIYVEGLEREGCSVHWPKRDTRQDDPIGITICDTNRLKIWEAHEVHVWYDSKSQGSSFDFGMTYAFCLLSMRKIVIINPDEVHPTPHKSFQNVLLAMAEMTKDY
jgi:hypothetical protein